MKMYLYILFLLFIFPICSHSEMSRKVTVTGVGATKDSALLDAKKKAISIGLGTFISSETVIENFMLKHDQIIAKSKGFVTDVKILSQKKTKDNQVQLKIRACVSEEYIYTDMVAMKNLLHSYGNPRIIVLIDDVNSGNQEKAVSISQVEVENQLLKRGYTLVEDNSKLKRL